VLEKDVLVVDASSLYTMLEDRSVMSLTCLAMFLGVRRVSFSGDKCREAINTPRALIVGDMGQWHIV
jgi:hypothetical protein